MSLPSRHANMKTTAKTERGKGPRLLFVLIDKRIIQNMSLPSRHANMKTASSSSAKKEIKIIF